MAWVMTSKKVSRGFEVSIGCVVVARIQIVSSDDVFLFIPTSVGLERKHCNSVSAAYKEMHRLLNSPPDIII